MGHRYDINPNKIPGSTNYKSLVDYLVFKNDEVFNLLVDRKKIERIMVVTNDEIPQNLFHSRQTVPRNTIKAISTNFFSYHPPTLGNYSSYYIK